MAYIVPMHVKPKFTYLLLLCCYGILRVNCNLENFFKIIGIEI